tara:strand:+ start:18 stop:149 length:132 start_codon:yes stop_codon:yes gene_type:complete
MDIYASYDLIVSNENIFMKKLYKPKWKKRIKLIAHKVFFKEIP